MVDGGSWRVKVVIERDSLVFDDRELHWFISKLVKRREQVLDQ